MSKTKRDQEQKKWEFPKRDFPWDDIPSNEEMMFKSLENKIEHLTKEIENIKNPPKKKSPLDGLSTYEKFTKIMGEVIFMGIFVVGIPQLLYGFFTGKYGLFFTTIFASVALYVFFDCYDYLAHHYNWKWKGKIKD